MAKFKNLALFGGYCLHKAWANIFISQTAVPTFVLSFDLDYKQDYDFLPRLLKSLKNNKIKASFACIGKFIEMYPDMHRKILFEGHELINHTYSHPGHPIFSPSVSFDKVSKRERMWQIETAHKVFSKVLNYAPRGFRAPHLRMTTDTYRILKELHYCYSSSQPQYKLGIFGQQKFIHEVLEFPLSSCPSHPRQIIETYHWFRSEYKIPFQKAETLIVTEFEKLLDETIRLKSFATVFFDPMDFALMRNFDYIFYLLKLRRQRSNLRVVRYNDLAKVLE